MSHLKPRRGPRQMDEMLEVAKEFMRTHKNALDKLDDEIIVWDTCPYMLEIKKDDSKCYCTARAREHCYREV